MKVTVDATSYTVHTEFHERHRVMGSPDSTYDKARRAWVMPRNRAVAKFLRSMVAAHEMEDGVATATEIDSALPTIVTHPFPRERHTFNEPPPLPHQLEELDAAYLQPHRGLFWWMGCAKTRVMIDLNARYMADGQIDKLLIVCPNAIKSVWVDQINQWWPSSCLPDGSLGIYVGTGPVVTRARPCVRVCIVGIESLSAGGMMGHINAWVDGNTSVVVDESQRIKNASAKRTQNVTKLGAKGRFRYILTGTPITKGIEDLYAQIRFLNPSIIGRKSFYSFRNYFCIMGGFESRKIVGYRNSSELLTALTPHISYIPEEVAVAGLPPKMYETRRLVATTEQKQLVKSLKTTMEAEIEGKTLTVVNVVGYMMRAMQIAGGFFPYVDEDGTTKYRALDGNPKMDALLEIAADTDHKLIVFCAFRAEREAIVAALRDKYGPNAVATLVAAMDTAERGRNIDNFQEDPDCRFFVSTQALGSVGMTLTAARLVVYYSNGTSWEYREQSESRAHRIGQTHPVMNIDLTTDIKVEARILDLLMQKDSLAAMVSSSLSNPASMLDMLD